MIDIHNLTLSDFLQMPIKRTRGSEYVKRPGSFLVEGKRPAQVAEIIFDHTDGRPVRLMGFVTDGTKSDFEIAEEGLEYWRGLYERLTR